MHSLSAYTLNSAPASPFFLSSFLAVSYTHLEAQRDIILSLAEKGSCVIVGRCANQILKGRSLSVFIHAPFDLRVRNVQARTGREERSARKMVKRTDKERRAYYEFFTDAKWTDLSQYDLCIDSSRFTQDQILEILTAVSYTHLDVYKRQPVLCISDSKLS